MSTRPELQPGSTEPKDPERIDDLLSAVPELAFFAAFDPCVPTSVDDGNEHHAAVDRQFGPGGAAAVVAALETLAQRAADENNGGLAFLVKAMLHFVREEPVVPSMHPLFVALYLRALARARGGAETPAAIAAAMDHWS